MVAVAVAITLTLAALEIVLRLFFPGIGALRTIITRSQGTDSRAYVLQPGADIVFTGLHDKLEKPARWQVNGQGIRSDRAVPPKTGKFRVVTFGDSETFGWSVTTEDTFQRRMESIDPDVEVLNLGVPGYNAENVADHMKQWLTELKPEFVVYMFHKNDLDPPLKFTPGLTASWLYLLWRKSVDRIKKYLFPESVGNMKTPENLQRVSGEFARMIRMTRKQGVPFLVGFLDWRFTTLLPPDARIDCSPGKAPPPCSSANAPGHWVGMIDMDAVRQGHPRFDDHMGTAAHREAADRICHVISGGREGRCTPPYWTGSR